MNIRQATIEDLKSVQELNSMLFKKEIQDYGEDFDDSWGFSEDGTEYISQWIQGENCLTLVAEENGKIIGYLAAEIRDLPAWRKQSKSAEIVEIFVLTEFRGHGIGSQLVEKCLLWCRKKGVQKVKLEASAGNADGIRFYKKFGLKEKEVVLELEL